jgi:hypothetical protein
MMLCICGSCMAEFNTVEAATCVLSIASIVSIRC